MTRDANVIRLPAPLIGAASARFVTEESRR